MKDSRSSDIGSRLQKLRLASGLSLDKLSEKSGIDPTLISRYENGHRNISLTNQRKLADAFGIDIEELVFGVKTTNIKRTPLGRNPKPIRLNDVVLESIFLMLGNHSEPLEISLQYDPKRLVIPPKIRPIYESLAAESKTNAFEKGFPYFNGPNTRLLRATEANTRQATTGKEIRGVVLELGPVSWEEFTVLNCYLDRRLLDDGKKPFEKFLQMKKSCMQAHQT